MGVDLIREGLRTYERAWIDKGRNPAILGFVMSQDPKEARYFTVTSALARWIKLDDHLRYVHRDNGVSVRDIFMAVFGRDDESLGWRIIRDDMFLLYAEYKATLSGFPILDRDGSNADEFAARLRGVSLPMRRAHLYGVMSALYAEHSIVARQTEDRSNPYSSAVFFSRRVENAYRAFCVSNLFSNADFLELTPHFHREIVPEHAPRFSAAAGITADEQNA